MDLRNMAEHMQIWLNLKTSIQLHWTGKKVLPQLNWISLMYARYWTQKYLISHKRDVEVVLQRFRD